MLQQVGLPSLSAFLECAGDAEENRVLQTIPRSSRQSLPDEQEENSEQFPLTVPEITTQDPPAAKGVSLASPLTPGIFPGTDWPVGFIRESQPATAAAASGVPKEINITGAMNVNIGSNNQISCQVTPNSRRFTPIVKELKGREKEMRQVMEDLCACPSPIVMLLGIVGIGKSSLGKAICKLHLQKQTDVGKGQALFFMVQFTAGTLTSPLMVYKEIVIQIFGGDDLGLDDLDESGYQSTLASLSRQLPSNSIVLIDDCEHVSSVGKTDAFAKALDILMTCSSNIKVVLASLYDVTFHDLPNKRYFLEGLSQEAAVQMLQTARMPYLPDEGKLRRIAESCFCHPLALRMVIELLPSLALDSFLYEMNDQETTQITGLGEQQALHRRLKDFFLRLEKVNPCEFGALAELSILPGKFSLDDWELERATVRALQERLVLEVCQSEGKSYWRIPPIIREFASEVRQKESAVDQRAKVQFANYCCKILGKLSSRLFSDARSVLQELDMQRANVQLLLRCVTDWSEDFKTCPDLLEAVFPSLTYPGVGYMLQLRFSTEDRLAAFQALSSLISDGGVTELCNAEAIGKVHLELSYIRRMIFSDRFQNLRAALDCAETALKLFGGEKAADTYKAECLLVKGRVSATLRASQEGWYETALETLKAAGELCEKIRAQNSSANCEKYLTWTDHLATVWKELAFVNGERLNEYSEGLKCLENAIRLRSEVFGPGHITLVTLLIKSGKIRATWARELPDTDLFREDLLHLSTNDLRKAIVICREYAYEGHPLSGIAHFVLGRTLTDRKMFFDALDEFEESTAVFKASGLNYRLASAHSERGCCFKSMGDTKTEVSCHRKCLELLQGVPSSNRKLILSTWRNLADSYKRLNDQTNYRDCMKELELLSCGSRR